MNNPTDPNKPTPWATARARALVDQMDERSMMPTGTTSERLIAFGEMQDFLARVLDEARAETLFQVRDWLTDEDTDGQITGIIETLEANIADRVWSGPWPRHAPKES